MPKKKIDNEVISENTENEVEVMEETVVNNEGEAVETAEAPVDAAESETPSEEASSTSSNEEMPSEETAEAAEDKPAKKKRAAKKNATAKKEPAAPAKLPSKARGNKAFFKEFVKNKQKKDTLTGRKKTATKKQKREMYSIDGYISANEEVGFMTPQKLAKENYLTLNASYKSNSRLKGVIAGVAKFEGMQMPCAKILFDEWTVLIPIDELIPNNCLPATIEGSSAEKKRSLANLIRTREGCEISFVVIGMDEPNKLAAASRLRAQAQIRNNYWFQKTRGQNSHYKIEEGSLLEGTVTGIYGRWLCVDALGVESRVDVSECSYNRITLSDYFYAGQAIPVKVKSVKREEGIKDIDGRWKKQPVVEAEYSIKEALPNPKQKYFRQFEVGEVYKATVTHVDASGVYVLLSGVAEAMCFYQTGEANVPLHGDQLMVRVVKKNPETFDINCEIYRRLPKVKPLY